MTKASGFIPAAADVPCQDVWMVERIRATAMKAYKRLEQGGELKIVYPVRLYKSIVDYGVLEEAAQEE